MRSVPLHFSAGLPSWLSSQHLLVGRRPASRKLCVMYLTVSASACQFSLCSFVAFCVSLFISKLWTSLGSTGSVGSIGGTGRRLSESNYRCFQWTYSRRLKVSILLLPQHHESSLDSWLLNDSKHSRARDCEYGHEEQVPCRNP